MTRANADNLFGISSYIVDPLASKGSYTSVQTAINQAVADGHDNSNPAQVVLNPGLYIEDVTMAPGIDLVGFCDVSFNAPIFDPSLVAPVRVMGLLTVNYSGLANIQGISFLGNGGSAFLMSTPVGPIPTILQIANCSFYADSAPTMSCTSTNGNVFIYNTIVQQEGAFGFVDLTGTLDFNMTNCFLQSLGKTATNSTISSGNFRLGYSISDSGITCSGTGSVECDYSSLGGNGNFVIDQSSSNNVTLLYCTIRNNAPFSCINIALGSSVSSIGCFVNGTSPQIVGTGTLNYDHLFETDAISGTVNAVTFPVLPVSGTTLQARGHAYFDPLDFTVDSDGQVHSIGRDVRWNDQPLSITVSSNSGSFITGPGVTLTLPPTPTQGDVCEFVCLVNPAVVQANAGQAIAIGSSLSGVMGTVTNTAVGDSLRLIFRSGNNTWYSVPGTQGNWIIV